MNENELLRRLLDLKIKVSSMPFNLMSLMYEKIHGKEVIQSTLLAGLLDPNENHKFGDLLIKQFFKYLELDKTLNLEEIKDIVVKTERTVTDDDKNNRRIDILITFKYNGEDHAIIIENKLHNANEQKDQLDDYFYRIKNEGYIVDKIVFMPLNKEYYKPHASYETMQKVVPFDAGNIIHWLNNSIEEAKKDNIEHSALVQYKDFFECLIDKNKNIMEIQKIINEFSPSEIKKIEEIANLINTDSWIKARFKLITEFVKAEKNNISVLYFTQGYVQLFFEGCNLWVELWLRENHIDFYLVSKEKIVEDKEVIKKGKTEFIFDEYDKGNKYYYYSTITNFDYPKNAEDDNMRKIKEILLPVLDELENYKE